MFRVAAPRYYDGIVSSIRDIGKETHYGLRMAFYGIWRTDNGHLNPVPISIHLVAAPSHRLYSRNLLFRTHRHLVRISHMAD